MSEKNYTFKLDMGKIMTGVATVIILGFGKAAFDVYAFSQTRKHIVKKIQDHDEKLLAFGATIEKKADKSKMESVEKKVDKVLTILCTMNNNRPQDCAR